MKEETEKWLETTLITETQQLRESHSSGHALELARTPVPCLSEAWSLPAPLEVDAISSGTQWEVLAVGRCARRALVVPDLCPLFPS